MNWRHSLFYLFKFLLVGIEYIDGSDNCSKAPYRDCQFIGVEEIVEEAMDEIADESEGGT